MDNSDSLVLSKPFENYLPRPETIDCECLICSSNHNVVAVRKISIPPISVILRTEEARCDKHYEFAKCSFCHEYFDLRIMSNEIKKPTQFPAILCPSHQKCTRCKNCGKWADSGHFRCQTCQKLDRPIKGKYYKGFQPTQSEDLRIWTLDKMACHFIFGSSNLPRSPVLNDLHTLDIRPMNFTNIWTSSTFELTTGKT